MNATQNRTKSVTVAFGLAVVGAAASALLSLGAGIAHAGEFDPQPGSAGPIEGLRPAARAAHQAFRQIHPFAEAGRATLSGGVNVGH